jgi:hypothetical protein
MATQSTIFCAKIKTLLNKKKKLNRLLKRIRRFRARSNLSNEDYYARFPVYHRRVETLRNDYHKLENELSGKETLEKAIIIRKTALSLKNKLKDSRHLYSRFKEKMRQHFELIRMPEEVILEVLEDPLPPPPLLPPLPSPYVRIDVCERRSAGFDVNPVLTKRVRRIKFLSLVVTLICLILNTSVLLDFSALSKESSITNMGIPQGKTFVGPSRVGELSPSSPIVFKNSWDFVGFSSLRTVDDCTETPLITYCSGSSCSRGESWIPLDPFDCESDLTGSSIQFPFNMKGILACSCQIRHVLLGSNTIWFQKTYASPIEGYAVKYSYKLVAPIIWLTTRLDRVRKYLILPRIYILATIGSLVSLKVEREGYSPPFNLEIGILYISMMFKGIFFGIIQEKYRNCESISFRKKGKMSYGTYFELIVQVGLSTFLLIATGIISYDSCSAFIDIL